MRNLQTDPRARRQNRPAPALRSEAAASRSATGVEMMVARVTTLVGWCLCLAVCQVKGSYVPADMNRTIQNLLDHYVSTG